MSFLPGMFPAIFEGAATPDATVSFTDESGSTADQTVYSFTSRAFGSAAANRHIIVGVATRKSSSSIVVASMTIGGVSATEAAAVSWENEDVHMSWWIATVPTGTTGTVVVTFNEETDRCAIVVYRAVDLLSATPTDSASDVVNADPIDVGITIDAGGFALAIAYSQTTTTATWTGLTEASDAQYEITASSAFLNSAAGGAVTASCNWGTADTAGILAVAFR